MKLPRLQLHLSTLLILTILAAALVWLNVREQPITDPPDTSGFGSGVMKWVVVAAYGWPSPSLTIRVKAQDATFGNINSNVPPDNEPRLWHTGPLALNIVSCLSLLVLAAVGSEWLTRRITPKARP